MSDVFSEKAASLVSDFGNIVTDQNMLLGPAGVSAFSLAKIIAWITFGAVGFAAFVYGKKERSFKPLVVGIALMGYPYFVNATFWLYAVGIGLCLVLYFWRD